jgi:hypothetical protein
LKELSEDDLTDISEVLEDVILFLLINLLLDINSLFF